MNTVDYLQHHDIKPSVQRLAIMDYLQSHCTHPTVDEIFTALSPQMPTLSRTTVYNTLKLFVQMDVARMLTIDENNIHYDGCTTPHSHFHCKRCGKILDISHLPCPISDLSPEGLVIDEVHLYYKGVCPACRESGKSDIEQE